MSALASSLARAVPLVDTPRGDRRGACRAARTRLSVRARSSPSDDDPVDPEMVDGAEGPRGPPPAGTGVVLPAETWTSPTWNWGSARGDAHDAAQVVRAHLNRSPEVRKSWLVALISSTPLAPIVPWEEAKLVMALAWQLAGHRGTDACGSGEGSWLDVMERMRQGVYEDTAEKSLSGGGDRALAFELAERLGPGGKALIKQASDVAIEATQGDEEWVHDAVRRAACAAMLLDLEFLEEGI